MPMHSSPAALVEGETGAASPARIALLVAMVGLGAQLLASVGALHDTVRVVDRIVNSKNGTVPKTTVNPALSLVSNLGLVAVLVGLVLFMIWSFRAAKAARAVGIHGQWAPGWFIGAWFIPIANLVLPYLCVKSLLPAGHPGIRTIQRWWAFFVAQYLLSFVAVTIGWALYENDHALGVWPWIPAGLSLGCIVAAAIYGREMISTIVATHAERVGIDPTAV
jgi:hypothetical protein